jgi:DNA-binding response OmpR family regulator
MNHCAYEARSSNCALWNRKTGRFPTAHRRVLVAHADRGIGESIVLLLGLKGFSAQHVANVTTLRSILETWQPQAVFLDTRIGGIDNYALARELRATSQGSPRLLIAMSSFLPDEPMDLLKDAGYDGLSRRPCPMWQIADLLDSFYASGWR